VITPEELKEIKKRITGELERGLEASKSHVYSVEDWSTYEWDQLKVS